jgi:hypothetical protein
MAYPMKRASNRPPCGLLKLSSPGLRNSIEIEDGMDDTFTYSL